MNKTSSNNYTKKISLVLDETNSKLKVQICNQTTLFGNEYYLPSDNLFSMLFNNTPLMIHAGILVLLILLFMIFKSTWILIFIFYNIVIIIMNIYYTQILVPKLWIAPCIDSNNKITNST